jgi:hypothetical protein
LALASAVQGRSKNYFPITGTFFSCSFNKEFGSRACSSGALQKLFSQFRGAPKTIFLLPVPSLTALLTRNLALTHAVQGRFKNYFPITGAGDTLVLQKLVASLGRVQKEWLEENAA